MRAAQLAAGLSSKDLGRLQEERDITNITVDNTCRLADFLRVGPEMLFAAPDEAMSFE
ncbi:hypothetical protein ACTMU2_18165 [Cupriavidus basilensis]